MLRPRFITLVKVCQALVVELPHSKAAVRLMQRKLAVGVRNRSSHAGVCAVVSCAIAWLEMDNIEAKNSEPITDFFMGLVPSKIFETLIYSALSQISR